jgi:hypothetical protein
MILAIDAAPAAIPVKPKTAATSAITRNVNVHRNIALYIWLSPLLTPITCHLFLASGDALQAI